MKIKNINGTSQTTCACGSWLKHWEKFSGQTVTYCPATGALLSRKVSPFEGQFGTCTDDR